jgi:hypothetical protein
MPLKFWPFKRRQPEVVLRPWLSLCEDDRSNLKSVGYWRSDPFSDLPHPKDYVDSQWNSEERLKVMQYLEAGYTLAQCMGPSWCRMGCENIWMGSHDFTDGTWVYPEGYVHYLDIHGVRPPDEFLEHIRVNDYSMPVFSEDRIRRPQYVKQSSDFTLGYFIKRLMKEFFLVFVKFAGVILILMLFGYLLFSVLALFN